MNKEKIKILVKTYAFYMGLYSFILDLFAYLNMKFVLHMVRYDFLILPTLLGMLIGYLLAYNSLLKKKLEKSNSIKSEFLTKISHELRTPLNSILGFTQLLLMKKDRILTDKDLEGIGQVYNSSVHLLELVNELLDLSRIESGKLLINMTEVNLAELLKKSINMNVSFAQKHNVKIIYEDISPEIKVYADRTRLQQVILNLLSNAIKYNCANGKVIIKVTDPDDGEVAITVQDTGSGIPETSIAYLFEPFHRLEIHKDIDGVGVGLTISKKLMELQGGDILCSSIPGKGSIFTVLVKKPG